MASNACKSPISPLKVDRGLCHARQGLGMSGASAHQVQATAGHQHWPNRMACECRRLQSNNSMALRGIRSARHAHMAGTAVHVVNNNTGHVTTSSKSPSDGDSSITLAQHGELELDAGAMHKASSVSSGGVGLPSLGSHDRSPRLPPSPHPTTSLTPAAITPMVI
jgi:hypothetical protein